MRHVCSLVFAFLVAVSFPAAALAQVVINEVLFDPSGSDTGLEWVELYNASDGAMNLSGWQLYPDGIGYFYFPEDFSVPAKGYVAVNLRASGQNSETNLYHSATTSNMGNSSGSLALFSGEPRGSDTIKSFVRYHKPGSSERKTWESSAVEAGLWRTGDFIDIGSMAEGVSVGLTSDGVAAGFKQAWEFFSSATKGTGNSQASNNEPPDANQTSTTTSSANTAPLYVIPRLDVDIETPTAGVIGAPHRFAGYAFGSDKKPVVGNVRFLWNFNDGTVAEGPAVTHIFRFPGSYTVSLNVNTGSGAIGHAIRDVNMTANAVFFSEALAGIGGFVELENRGREMIDLSGWLIDDQTGRSFTIPLGTKIRGGNLIVFPNRITGLAATATSSKILTLRFGNMTAADTLAFLDASGMLATAAGGGSFSTAAPTPGAKNSQAVSRPAPVSVDIKEALDPVSAPINDGPVREVAAATAVIENGGEEPNDPPVLAAAIGLPQKNNKWIEIMLFAGAFLLGIAGVLFVFFSKRPS